MDERVIAIVAVIVMGSSVGALAAVRRHSGPIGTELPRPTSPVAASDARGTEPVAALGVIAARQSVDVAAKQGGRVARVLVRIGDHVKKDQPLAILDARTAIPDVRAAEAQLRALIAEADRAAIDHELAAAKATRFADGAEVISLNDREAAHYQEKLSAADVKKARALAKQQEAKLQQLRVVASDLVVRAPFDGTIAARRVDDGGTVATGAPIVRILSDGDLVVRFGVELAARDRYEPESEVAVAVFLAGPSATEPIRLRGVVERVAPEVDRASGLVLVEALLDVPPAVDTALISGLTARVTPFTTVGAP